LDFGSGFQAVIFQKSAWILWLYLPKTCTLSSLKWLKSLPEKTFTLIQQALISKSLTPRTMTDSPKYDLRGAKIGNFAETVQGDQKSVQHNYAEQLSLAETVQEIQALLDQLSQTYPTTTLSEKGKLASAALVKIDAEPTRPLA
jgi:hypothetical protein